MTTRGQTEPTPMQRYIIEHTLHRHGVTLAEFAGSSRSKAVMAARDAVVDVIRRRYWWWSWPDIARLVGKGHHSNIHARWHARNAVQPPTPPPDCPGVQSTHFPSLPQNVATAPRGPHNERIIQ